MLFDLRAPCSDCPFLRDGGIRLSVERVQEIAGAMLDTRGATFACHKTTLDCEDDEDGDGRREGPQTQHCAGALIFAEKNENATQMMWIAERLGMYDMRKLVGHTRVFDTLDEMLATAFRPRRAQRAR
jgi:hypothetical protein